MIFSKTNLPIFIYEEEAYSGVDKVADYVRCDIGLVFGNKPDKIVATDADIPAIIDKVEQGVVIFGTIGKSRILDKYITDGTIDITDIKSINDTTDTTNLKLKREVYLFHLIEEKNILIIAGSDKRGTIYGLFNLSRILGVSPFVDWSDLKPRKLDTFELTAKVNKISKEPSVKYRGFFINDEWPAFGNFAMKRFGGVNAKLYEVIFTMLLRMNGNYLWPAMWASNFALDGPGLLSAELADELGVVMGLSHHEPCLRHGEEYTMVRGKDSIYGDAWDFISNREGIIRFWRDGLKRNGHLENVITIGMRGERDSMIMGKDSTLADNIGLLKDVIRTQNELIKEEVNPDLTKVPRMLALYKEVEPFFFGDENTPGLIGDECLDGVILLLCDDNHGYLRSRPIAFCENDEEKSAKTGKFMPKGNNGYGLYYHFDYHGDPISYEWVNSTYLPEVWEELTEAYETGIRDLFIVNVGDVGFNELSLNYFMDFAYDYDNWGINHKTKMDYPDVAFEHTKEWFEFNFAGSFDEQEYEQLAYVWTGTSRLIHSRRPEHMNIDVYPAKNFARTLEILKEVNEMTHLMEEFENKCMINKDAFIQLVSFQVKASLNLVKMWIYKGFNRVAAEHGMLVTNLLADKLEETFDTDNKLTEQVHNINNGLYYGLALADHIGFKHWNDEESAYPSSERIRLYKRKDIIVGVDGSDETTTGQYWSGKKLSIENNQAFMFYVASCGTENVEYEIKCDEGIILEKKKGELSIDNPVDVIQFDIAYDAYAQETAKTRSIYVTSGDRNNEHNIEIEVNTQANDHLERDAGLYNSIFNRTGETIYLLERVGNTSNGIKLYKENEDGTLAAYNNGFIAPDREKDADDNFAYGMSVLLNRKVVPDGIKDNADNFSYTAYEFELQYDSIYELTFTFLPCNPRQAGENIYFGYTINDSHLKLKKVLNEYYSPGVSDDWADGVLRHERDVTVIIKLKAGKNTIKYYPVQAENVLLSISLDRLCIDDD